MDTNLKQSHPIENRDIKQLLPFTVCLSREFEMSITSSFIENYEFFLYCLTINDLYILEKCLLLLKGFFKLKIIREFSEENGICNYLFLCFDLVQMHSNNSKAYITICEIIQLFEHSHSGIGISTQKSLMLTFISDSSLDIKKAIISGA